MEAANHKRRWLIRDEREREKREGDEERERKLRKKLSP